MKKEVTCTSVEACLDLNAHVYSVNPWAEPRDAEEVDEREVKMRADMMSELVAVCILLPSKHADSDASFRSALCGVNLRRLRR